MARLSLFVENCAANYLRGLQDDIAEGVNHPKQFKDVQAALQRQTKVHIERAQLRRIAKEVKIDFDKVIVAPAGKTSLLATAHTNLTALTERVVALEEIVARMDVRIRNGDDGEYK